MISETGEDNFLEDFGGERKVGDRTVVTEVVRIKGRFFKEMSDKSRFEEGGESTRGKGEIDDVSDWNGDDRKERLNKKRRNGVKGRRS